MKTVWMGRYKKLIDHLMAGFNVYSRTCADELELAPGCKVSYVQMQVLEYLMENEDKMEKMAIVASNLGMLPSAFSKLISRLMEKGYIEKHHANDNRKDIILKVSRKGHEIYDRFANTVLLPAFKPMFDALSSLSDSEVDFFANSLAIRKAE